MSSDKSAQVWIVGDPVELPERAVDVLWDAKGRRWEIGSDGLWSRGRGRFARRVSTRQLQHRHGPITSQPPQRFRIRKGR
jgi:hypothetical protein